MYIRSKVKVPPAGRLHEQAESLVLNQLRWGWGGVKPYFRTVMESASIVL